MKLTATEWLRVWKWLRKPRTVKSILREQGLLDKEKHLDVFRSR